MKIPKYFRLKCFLCHEYIIFDHLVTAWQRAAAAVSFFVPKFSPYTFSQYNNHYNDKVA